MSRKANKTRKCPCPFEGCARSFDYPSGLRRHVRTHTKEKPFHCKHPGCTKSFAEAYKLGEHMQSHDKGKPFQCHTCLKWFKTKKWLSQHILTHISGRQLREYVCRVCDEYSSTDHDKLFRHIIKRHPNTRIFECHTCVNVNHYWCYNLAELRRHFNQLHLGMKPFACNICLRKFVTRANVTRHKNKAHSTEMVKNNNSDNSSNTSDNQQLIDRNCIDADDTFEQHCDIESPEIERMECVGDNPVLSYDSTKHTISANFDDRCKNVVDGDENSDSTDGHLTCTQVMYAYIHDKNISTWLS